jgi:hypothetical protein
MTKLELRRKKRYFVVGFKTDPERGSVMAFIALKSAHPSKDIEKALDAGCHFATARLLEGEDGEKEAREYAERIAGPCVSDATGRYYDPPLEDGILTYQVRGMVEDRVNPGTGRMSYRTNFIERTSSMPRYDVDRALRAGSVHVSVGVNYEPSEDAKMEAEYDRKREIEFKEWLDRESEKVLDADD